MFINIKFKTFSKFLVSNDFESILLVQGEWSVLISSCKLPEPLKLSTEISSVWLLSLMKSDEFQFTRVESVSKEFMLYVSYLSGRRFHQGHASSEICITWWTILCPGLSYYTVTMNKSIGFTASSPCLSSTVYALFFRIWSFQLRHKYCCIVLWTLEDRTSRNLSFDILLFKLHSQWSAFV